MDSGVKRAKAARIDGRGCYLVPFSEAHLRDPRYLAWLNDYEVVKSIGRPEYLRGVSFEEIDAYVRRLSDSENDLFFAVHVSDDDSFIGTAKAGHIDRRAGTADIGVMIGSREHWGRSLATDGVRALCRFMFLELGIRKLTSGVMGGNPAMARVFEKLGFQREAVLRKQVPFEGSFVDHVLYGCFPEELRGAGDDRAADCEQESREA